MMRRLFFFALGLLLGSWSVISFAQSSPVKIDLNIRTVTPPGLTVSGAWDALVPGVNEGYRASDFGAGSGEVYRGAAVRVGDVPVTLEAKRRISAAGIAKGARAVARRAGPAGLIGSILLDAGLEWANNEWQITDVSADAPNVVTGGDWYDPYDGCSRLGIGQTGINKPGPSAYEEYRVEYPFNNPGGGFQSVNNCTSKPAQNGQFPALFWRVVSSPYVAPTETLPATDEQLEGALTDGLVDGDLTPEQALAEIEASGDFGTVAPEFQPTQVSGPTSVPAGTKTSTTSGPDGQTTTTETTTHDIEYDGDTARISTRREVSTTNPAGQTTTTTETSSGDSGTPPTNPPKPEEVKTDCDKYPNASGCVELGNPDEDIDLEEEEIEIPDFDYQSETGSCPADITISPSLVSRSFTLSYEPVCTAAEFLRPVIILVALLTAGAYVFVSVKGIA